MTPPTEISIAAFVKRHSANKHHVMRERLLPWVAWYWRDGRCGVIREDGRIVGVAFVRCLDAIEKASMPYAHDEDGRFIWVDDIISRRPYGIAIMLKQAAKRFGRREAFAGTVLSREGELRMLPWKTVERLLAATT